MSAFESARAGVPSVKLVVVQPQGQVPQIANILPIANLRQQRIEQFLDLKDLAPRTRKTYAQQLGWFSDWVDKDWQTVNLNDVRRYKLYLEQERQLKPNSIALALSSLKSFYTWLKLAGYVVENPMTAVSVPRPAEAE
jgi:integrase/recombinase XerD